MNKERRTRKRERNFWWKYLRLKEKEEEGGGEDGLWWEGKGLIWYWMWGSQWCSHGNWEIEMKASKAKKPISVLTVECGVWSETDGGFFVYLKIKERRRTRGRFQVSTNSANHESESEPEPQLTVIIYCTYKVCLTSRIHLTQLRLRDSSVTGWNVRFIENKQFRSWAGPPYRSHKDYNTGHNTWIGPGS